MQGNYVLAPCYARQVCVCPDRVQTKQIHGYLSTTVLTENAGQVGNKQ